MNRQLAWGLCFCLVLISTPLSALAPAGITIDSALNQPLQARIPLLNATPAELASLKVTQADGRALTQYDFRFRVQTDSSGRSQLWLTTLQAVKEPALSFVLEFVWDGGQLSRQYSILLDPQ